MPIKTLEEFLKFLRITLCEKCPYSELFWSTYSCIRTEYGEIRSISRSISPYSVQMRKNADQNNSEYGVFTQCICFWNFTSLLQTFLGKCCNLFFFFFFFLQPRKRFLSLRPQFILRKNFGNDMKPNNQQIISKEQASLSESSTTLE